MSFVDRDGAMIYYEERGAAGTALLLSHGFACSARLWWPQVDSLSDRFRVIAWDARGHDRSDSPKPEQYSRDLSVGDMLAILNACDVGRVVLIGHSMGSLLSVNFALAHPERTAALVLVGGGAAINSSDARERQQWNAAVERIAVELERYGLEPPPPQEGAFSAGSIMYAPEAQLAKHRSAVGLARAARGTFTFHDDSTFNRLAGIDAPTLVVAGEQEVRFMDSARHLAQMIPNARLEIVAGAGHSPNLEQPDEFNRLVQFFLDQVGISTAHGKPPART